MSSLASGRHFKHREFVERARAALASRRVVEASHVALTPRVDDDVEILPAPMHDPYDSLRAWGGS